MRERVENKSEQIKGYITIDITEIQSISRKYYEELVHKIKNLLKMINSYHLQSLRRYRQTKKVNKNQ